MEIRIQHDLNNIDWEQVVDILKKVGMAYYSSDKHQRAFQNSHSVVFIFNNTTLVGFGRAISDGEYQSALYDVAVLPEYQGRGIGRLIVKEIINQSPECNFILYASPGKEKFYEKLTFRRLKTGMALFKNKARMHELGFTM